jgi:hypothetical protein
MPSLNILGNRKDRKSLAKREITINIKINNQIMVY